MFGANWQGSLPPLFCVINAEYEFANLAEALGPEQPVYAFRSLYFDRDCNDEDLIEALALGYVKDLEQVHPDGPLFYWPTAKAAISPSSMAQHLLRRGRPLPLLVLLEWMMKPVSFSGDVLLLYARDSTYNPKFDVPQSRTGLAANVRAILVALRSTETMMSLSTTPPRLLSNWRDVFRRLSIGRARIPR